MQTVGGAAAAFAYRSDALMYSSPRDVISTLLNVRIKGRRLGVNKQFTKPPHPTLPDEGIVPQQSTFFILDILL